MTLLKRFLDYSIFSLAILLAFLVVFARFLEVPDVVEWFGYWHPVVLHFPIVLILITIIQYWRKDNAFRWFLSSSAFLTLVTAITGFILSLEGDVKGKLISTHQWLGVSLTYIMVIWYWMDQERQLNRRTAIFLQGVLIVLILLTGHWGGMVTHGPDFLTFASRQDHKSSPIPENPNIFEHIVQPILKKKCVSCHNTDKSKGELVLSDYRSIITGGETGSAVDVQDLSNSLILRKISLPPDDKEHMPPQDEDQLTETEKILISEWIRSGAVEMLQFSDLEEENRMYELVQNIINEQNMYKWKDLPEVSDNEIVKLSSNYVRISRIFNSSNALQVIVYPHSEYRSPIVSNLKSVARNIIELNVSGLPFGEEEIKFIVNCDNLEKLNLSKSTIGDENLSELTNLERLSELSVYNTDLTDEAMSSFRQLKGLNKLFIYNTAISEGAIEEFTRERSDVLVIHTSEQVEEFKSVLPPPSVEPRIYFFRNPIKIKISHPLEGIDLFYTLDGSEPNETSNKISDSLQITRSTHLKFFAAREGWVSSPVDSMRLYRTIAEPDRFTLKHPPNPKYIGKGVELLFDLEKGPDDFGDSAWTAFREQDFILTCEWDKPVDINAVVLSSMVHTDPYLFPPESIIVRGGIERTSLKKLAQMKPLKLTDRAERQFEFYEGSFETVKVRFIEITVRPLQSIPVWHPGKGEKGWFFIDEVVFSKSGTI